MSQQYRSVATKPFSGQKPGTSGLRKKTTVFQQPHYVENFVQATFDALGGSEKLRGKTLVVGGDGRFFNKNMCQTICKMACANGLGRVWIPKDGLISTPAVSCVIRERENGVACGAFILTASHNPGGPTNDCGIKYNTEGGGPAPESLTDAIYARTEKIDCYFKADFADIDISKIGSHEPASGFRVEVIDGTEDYVKMVQRLFDMKLIKSLLSRKDFRFVYDGMDGVAGPFAKAVFHQILGVSLENLLGCDPSEDFNGGHPDPNLTYAERLVEIMGLNRDGSINAAHAAKSVPDFGAAADGDADRNMILGNRFFVTPSDSLAVLAAKVASCVPYFATGGLKSVARSMPTSAAVDLVAKKLNIPCFEVPTGWKFFVNLCDAKELGKGDWSPLLCGEESFGTGSSHIREKDGIFAVLCWLSVLAKANETTKEGQLVSVQQIVEAHWQEFGRNHYQRYDYEECDSGKAKEFTDRLTKLIAEFKSGQKHKLLNGFELSVCDEFAYTDPVDGSVSKNQGWRFLLADGSRFVFRLSGTGSSGATVRLYLEKFTPPSAGKEALVQSPTQALKPLIEAALEFAKLKDMLGRDAPTVIT